MPDIIKDDGFQIPTKPARNALICREDAGMDRDEAEAVASHLIGNIQRCFSKKSKNPRTALWKNYFQLRSSDAYKSFWKKDLLDSISGVKHVQCFCRLHNRASCGDPLSCWNEDVHDSMNFAR